MPETIFSIWKKDLIYYALKMKGILHHFLTISWWMFILILSNHILPKSTKCIIKMSLKLGLLSYWIIINCINYFVHNPWTYNYNLELINMFLSVVFVCFITVSGPWYKSVWHFIAIWSKKCITTHQVWKQRLNTFKNGNVFWPIHSWKLKIV